MSSDPSISPTLSQHDHNPITDNEMRKLIDKAFHEDAIWDAALDVLLSGLRKATRYNYVYYLFHPDEIYNHPKLEKSLTSLFEDAKKTFWDTISQHNISRELNENDVKKRDKLLHGDPPGGRGNDIPRYADSVLNAGVKVLEQTDCPYTKWPEVPDTGTMSLQHNAEVTLLDQLSAAVSNERATATFACGGEVPIAGHQDTNRSGTIGDRRVSSSVDVRWDSTSSEGRLVRFPVTPDSNSFQQLLLDCQPATFGRGGEDVLDESYRKAGKLDATRFCTSFDPYQCGIVDAVAQVLLPEIPLPSMAGKSVCPEHLGVSAELYKLNAYSGPLGCFGPHVDTPRSATHFASLVVCLPSPHQGGALVVRHEGNQLVYDWSSADPLEIGWAAFYSDCEHEVEQIQSGHRITLAYNLYVTDRVGWTLHQPSPSVDPSQMVLYGMLKSMLSAPVFLRSGGVLGLFCSHKYAHTNDSTQRRLPSALKGVDFAVYTAFRALGLPVKVAPILNYQYGYGGITLQDLRENRGLEVSKSAREKLQKFQEQGERDVCLEYEGEDSSDEEPRKHICQSHERSNAATDFESRLNQLKASRRVKGLTKRHIRRRDVTIGTCFQEIECLNEGDDRCGSDDILDKYWPHVSLPTVTWLNGVIEGVDEVQMAHLAYGNETSLECHYSAAAIFVVVPKYADREILPPSETRKRDYEAFREE